MHKKIRRPVLDTFRRTPLAFLALLGTLCLLNCSKSESPLLPSSLIIVSGDQQYSFHGTKLPEPLMVKAIAENGDPVSNAGIVFQVIQGGGSLSKNRVETNASGLGGVEFTLGPVAGINLVKAYLEVDNSKSVTFSETSSNYYCVEAETSPAVTYGPPGWLLLATFKSAIYSSTETNAGIVIIDPLMRSVQAFKEFPTENFITTVWDIALSPRGDLFIASSKILDQIIKISPAGETEVFSELEDTGGAELETNPGGMLVGCDRKGPFFLTCGDSLLRPNAAFYPQGGINNDALAVDQSSEDIYFISLIDTALMRLPVDSFAAIGPVETFAKLTYEEAKGANGMVWDSDGSIYILVDYMVTGVDSTKEFLRIDTQGIKTILFDFFSRGQGASAGTQNDLAINRSSRIIYTIDKTNNQLLGFNLLNPQSGFYPIITSEDISVSNFDKERVGLLVLP